MHGSIWQAQRHQLCTKAGVGNLWGSTMGPPARRQNLHPSYLKAEANFDLKGLDKNREMIASSWHWPPSSHLATLLAIIVTYRWKFAKFFSLCHPHSPIRRLAVSASCNSALHLKTSAPALKHGRCAMDHNIYDKNIERVISHCESAFCMSVCIQLCV